MVDLMEAESKPKLKFSPKFDSDTSFKKKGKKNKKNLDDGSTDISPAKKMKIDKTGNDSKPFEKKKKKVEDNKENVEKKGKQKSDKLKKRVSISDDVQVKEFAKESKKHKKDKLDIKEKKKKFSKDGKDKGSKKDKKKVVMLNKQETREKQKKVKEVRKKFKQEDIFDIGVKAKKVWEEVRCEDCPESKKDKLLNELHSLVKGNIKKIIFAHDTVRVVECLMALGSSDIRDKLFEEMKEDIKEMAKSKYAHFFVLKMLRYGNKDQKKLILKQMEGNIAKLMKNKTAGSVIEIMYADVATAAQRNGMLQEFLDPQFQCFKDPEIRTVPEILEKYPDRAKICRAELQKNVEMLINKGMYNHSLTHTVIYNYLLVAEPKHRAEVIEQLKESLIHMVHTREGAYAALQCIWHGTSKDRKAIVKSFKTFMLKTAQEEYGHMVLLGMFDSVDDTKLVGKAVIGELMENIQELFNNKYGVRVLKYLFGRRDPTYVNKEHTIAILEKGDGNEHSKKDADVRHKELVTIAAPSLLSYINEYCPGALYEAATTVTLTCILNNCPPSPQLQDTFTKLAKIVTKPFEKGDAAPNVVENTGSNMFFKKTIIKDSERAGRSEVTFSSIVLQHLDEDSLEAWLSCNRGCLLLLTMLNTEIKDVTTELVSKLKPYQKTIAKLESPSGKILQEKFANL